MTKVYRAWFEDPDGNRRHVDIPREFGIDAAAKGFWLKEDWSYSQGSDYVHFIPQCRLVIITKLDLPADGKG